MKLKLLIGALRFKVACVKADLLHTQKGFRYYVIPHPSKQGRLLAISKADIRLWKKMKMLNKNIDHLWIMENCLYFTDADGKAAIKSKNYTIEAVEAKYTLTDQAKETLKNLYNGTI